MRPTNGRRRRCASRATPANVSRDGERLRLKLENGGTVELADCRHGITAHAYLYEQYDEAGRFYVVRRPAYRDFSYTLVMRASGKQYRVYGTPVWTSDKKRFLTVACSWIPPRGTLTIQAPANGELATEGGSPAADLPRRDRDLRGALGQPVMDRRHLHARRRLEPPRLGVRRDEGERRRLEDVRALERLTHGWERAALQRRSWS